MKFWLPALFFIFSACSSTTGFRLSDQNVSLGEIKKAITAVIGDPRSISENQRTYLSQYFSRKPDPKFDAQKSRERLFSKIVILGDRRPYDLDIEVIIEQRFDRAYEQVGTDISQAKELGKQIRTRLHQGREDRNVIDDFRAF